MNRQNSPDEYRYFQDPSAGSDDGFIQDPDAAPEDHETEQPDPFPGDSDESAVHDPFELFSSYNDTDSYYASADEDEKQKRTIFKKRTRKPSFVLAVIVNAFRSLLILILVVILSTIGAIVGIAKAYVDTAPELDLAAIDDQAQTSFIYDSDYQLITEYKGTENRVIVPLSTMPADLQHAFVAVEDARFYTHNGIDIKRIVGSFIANSLTGSMQGGSTITQQLIKNTLLSSEKSYKRKIQEAYLAMQLENKYTKDQILECYLNTIYLGEDYYGVKTAAYGYFGKSDLMTLTLRECAMLAGVCNSPYYYNPRRNFYLRQSDTKDYPAVTNDRTDYVLRCMYENQFITYEQYQQALDPTSANVLSSSPDGNDLYKYPHYVEYAIQDAIRILLQLHSLENTSQNRSMMDRELRTGGYHIYLAIDTEIQSILEDSIYHWDQYPALRDPSDSVHRAKKSDGTYDEIIQPQAAAVIIDYRTGEIKAIVGSRTQPEQRRTLNRAVDMNMPVGSSIKPIAVYAPAIENGAGGGTILYNIPVPVSGWIGDDGNETWPQNYGGSNYRGPETLKTALVKSDNTAAAYCMANYVGVEQSVRYLQQLGVSSSHINATPFGVTLGSSGITPLEMSVAFGVLANSGVYQTPVSVLAITDRDGTVVFDAHQQQERRQVFKPSTAYLTVQLLKEAVASGTGTNAKISGQTVAGKTGTNSDQRGVTFAGMTGWYAGAVWIGHDNYKPLSSKTTGGSAAAKLWQSFMSTIHSKKGLSNRDIMDGSPSQYGLVQITTCAVSGQLATDACRNDDMGYGTCQEWWPRDSAPSTQCTMHHTLELCADSHLLATENCPNRIRKSVILLPPNHPLTRLIGTRYQDVLSDYFGVFSTLPMSENPQANAAVLSQRTCTYHSAGQSSGQYLDPSVAQDAQTLLASARLLLSTLDPSSYAAVQLNNAIAAMEQLLNSNPSTVQLLTAMPNLTQAMSDAQYY